MANPHTDTFYLFGKEAHRQCVAEYQMWISFISFILSTITTKNLTIRDATLYMTKL